MANLLLPPEERNLTPEQVEALDARRRRGHLFLVICFQMGIIATLILIAWALQDLTYSPGWAHPMAYYSGALYLGCILFGLAGLRLRSGHPEFN